MKWRPLLDNPPSTDSMQDAPEIRLAPPARLLVLSYPAVPAKPPVLTFDDAEIHVWLARPQPCTPQDPSLLSPAELDRMARFHFEEHRQDYLFTRSMLRTLLGAYLQVAPERLSFEYSEHGKPRLAFPFSETNLQFNLSHTRGAVLLAVCRKRPIGADIERVQQDFDLDEIANKFFSEEERESLTSLPEGVRWEAFFRCWTRKEALLKAKGGGLSLPLDLFDVSIGADESTVTLVTRPDPSEAAQWQILPVPVPAGYAAAVALGSLALETK